MKAAVVHSYAKPEVLDPQSRPGEALIHVAAAGVNPIDPARARGRHEGRVPLIFPWVLRWDSPERSSFSAMVCGNWRSARRFLHGLSHLRP
jgi:hypothetical protein